MPWKLNGQLQNMHTWFCWKRLREENVPGTLQIWWKRSGSEILLEEIERGKCSWHFPDLVQKIRIRVIAQKPASTQPKSFKSTKDKLCPNYNSNNCHYSSDHVVDSVIHKHACSYCQQEVGRWFSHKIHDCMRRKAAESNKEPEKN